VNNIKKFCQKCREAGDPDDFSWSFRKCNINECNIRTQIMQTDETNPEPCITCPDYTHPDESGSGCVNDNCLVGNNGNFVLSKSDGRCF
jgi:hypothetical protein